MFVAVLFLFTGTGMIIAKAYVAGLIILVVASFAVFSFSGVEMDTETRQIKQYNKWFGIFKSGRWESLDLYVGVTLIPIITMESMASMSNQVISKKYKDYRIFMVDQKKKPAFAIKKCKTLVDAQNSIDEFSIWLKLPVFSVKS